MSLKLPVAVTAIALFVLLIAFALPPAISATQNEDTAVLVVEEGATANVTEGLDVRNDNSTDSNATLTFTDTESTVSENITLSEGETGNVTLNDELVNATLDESSDSEVRVTVGFAHTYGWDDSAKTLAGLLDVLLALLAVVMVLGGIGWVIAS